MSNNKQSSVEWLIEQLTEVERKNWINNKILSIGKNTLAKQTFDGIIEQAKAMHKEEIVEAYASGSNDRLKNTINTNYYMETFGGNNGKALDN